MSTSKVVYRVTWTQRRRNSLRSKYFDFETFEAAQKFADRVLERNEDYVEVDGFKPVDRDVKVLKVTTITTFELLEEL